MVQKNGMLFSRVEGRWEKDVMMFLGYRFFVNSNSLKIKDWC